MVAGRRAVAGHPMSRCKPSHAFTPMTLGNMCDSGALQPLRALEVNSCQPVSVARSLDLRKSVTRWNLPDNRGINVPELLLCEGATTNDLIARITILAHDTCPNPKALRLMEAETEEWIEVLGQRRATALENAKRIDAALAMFGETLEQVRWALRAGSH